MVRIKAEDGIGADCSPSRKRSRVSPAATKSGKSRLAFPPQPLIEGLDRVTEIHRGVAGAIVFEKLQLVEKAERWGIKVQAVVDTGGSAEQDPAHVALSPRQIVPSTRRIRGDVGIEALARRGA